MLNTCDYMAVKLAYDLVNSVAYSCLAPDISNRITSLRDPEILAHPFSGFCQNKTHPRFYRCARGAGRNVCVSARSRLVLCMLLDRDEGCF